MLDNTSRLKSKLERLRLTDGLANQIKSVEAGGRPCVVKVVAQEYIVDMAHTGPNREKPKGSSQSQPDLMP
jgi:hypothetical protein